MLQRARLRLTRLLLLLGALSSVAVAGFAANVMREESVGQAAFLGSFEWHEDPRWFGGFSGFEFYDDGTTFIAITDSSHVVQGHVERIDGQIAAVHLDSEERLIDPRGEPVRHSLEDSEGLALASDGSYLVSFESYPRIEHHRGGKVKRLPRPAGFDQTRENGALEALAITPNGDVLTITERPLRRSNAVPVWYWDGKNWQDRGTYPQVGRFAPVGADFGPDGQLYVLERNFNFIGFRTRLVRYHLTNQGLTDRTVLMQSRTRQHDNLEGLSIWRDDQGRLRATMISDDNFKSFQRTEFVEYRLPG